MMEMTNHLQKIKFLSKGKKVKNCQQPYLILNKKVHQNNHKETVANKIQKDFKQLKLYIPNLHKNKLFLTNILIIQNLQIKTCL